MDNILNIDLNYDDILINEASKPFFFDTKRTNEKNRIDFMSLSKLKGLIQYINYKGLYHEDMRKISIILNMIIEKKFIIFRQFENLMHYMQ